MRLLWIEYLYWQTKDKKPLRRVNLLLKINSAMRA